MVVMHDMVDTTKYTNTFTFTGTSTCDATCPTSDIFFDINSTVFSSSRSDETYISYGRIFACLRDAKKYHNDMYTRISWSNTKYHSKFKQYIVSHKIDRKANNSLSLTQRNHNKRRMYLQKQYV